MYGKASNGPSFIGGALCSQRPEDRVARLFARYGAPAVLERAGEIDAWLPDPGGDVFVVLGFSEPVPPGGTRRWRLAIPCGPSAMVGPSMLLAVTLTTSHKWPSESFEHPGEVLIEIDDSGRHRHRIRLHGDRIELDSQRLVAALETRGLDSVGCGLGRGPESWADLVQSLTERRAQVIPDQLGPVIARTPPRERLGPEHALHWTARPVTWRDNVTVRLERGARVVATFQGGNDAVDAFVASSPVAGHRIADVLARHLARLYARRVPVAVLHPLAEAPGESDVLRGF